MVAATIHSDGAGNKYVGDCKWHNPDITFPLNYFLDSGVAFAFDNWPTGVSDQYDLSDTLTALYTSLGLVDVTDFTASDDGSIVTRLPAFSAGYQLYMTASTQFAPDGPHLDGLDTDGNTNFYNTSVGVFAPRHVSNIFSMSDNHFAGVFVQYDKAANKYGWIFRYGAKIQNINTNFAYYSKNEQTQSVVGYANQTTALAQSSLLGLWPLFQMKHQTDSGTGGVDDYTMQDGDANYSFVCADAQVPTADWATDFYIFDDNGGLGNPCIGRLPGLLIAQGTYEIMKPVKITSAATADSGSPWFLPVARYYTDTSKTVLMRVHSSMV